MKIRTQFMINLVVLGLILLLASAAVIISNQWLENAHQQEMLAAQIERQAYELGYLANDYLLYRESQQASRWEAKFASFSDDLSKVQVNTLEQQARLADIMTNQQRLKAVFADVRASIESAPQTAEAGFDEKFMQVSWSRMEVQTQGMIFNASRLERMLSDQEDQLTRLISLLDLVLIAGLGVFLLVIYWSTFRRILQAIDTLQDGTRTIGSGDLDFAIPVKSGDEIGELSRAFNRMTANLKQVTASKADLEKEIIERKRAEQIQQLERARWQGIVEGIADEVWMCDAQGKMSLLNLAAVTAMGLHMFNDKSVEDVYQEVDIFYPDGQPRPPEQAPLLRSLQGEIVRGEEIMRHRQTGKSRYRQFSSAPTRDANGAITGAVAIVRDITEQKAAEEGFRRYELLSKHSRDIILFMRREDGRILEANAAALQAYGYSREEMLALTIRDLRSPETHGLIANQMTQADAGGILFETVHRRRDGSTFPVESSWQGTTVGSVRTLVCIIRDITGREKAEAALRESEQRLKRAQEIAHLGSWELDLANNQLTWSDEVYRIFGLQPQEFDATYEAFLEAVHPDDRAAVDAAYSGSIQAGKDSYEIEHRAVRQSTGEIRIVYEKCEHFRNEAGQVIRSVGMVHDITERKQAEQEIASLAKFPMENPHPILRVQTDGQITYANAASQELLELWGCEVDDYLPEELRDFITVAVNDNSNKTMDVLCNDKVYSILLVPIVESGYVNAYGRDITERKRAEEELQRITEDLRRSNAELEQFAYVASHDLQEPLRMISSYVQLLAKRYQGKLDSDADEFIAFAVDGATRMQNLINDLLSYSRVGRRGDPLTSISCSEVLEEALTNLRIAIEESGAIITHEPLPVVKADRTQLVMVFQNLLGNAMKFRGSEPPSIHVGARCEGDEWIFSVRDNGIGIDPQFAERIFVIFQRLHDRSSYSGTGIGLAICRRIIQRHNGRIWVESQPGQGSTFYFTLPLTGTGLT